MESEQSAPSTIFSKQIQKCVCVCVNIHVHKWFEQRKQEINELCVHCTSVFGGCNLRINVCLLTICDSSNKTANKG